MDKNLIRVSRSSTTVHEILSVTQAISEGFLGHGEYTARFESLLSEYLGTDVITCNSGTSALILALQAAGIQNGSTVIMPSFTYVATAQAVTALGADIYFCDVNENGQLDVSLLDDDILQKACAIVVVHYGGLEIQLSPIFRLADSYSIRVIEDAAHSFGAKNIAKCPGERRFDFICYSFDGIKNITTAEGGAILARNMADQERIRNARMLGVHSEHVLRNKNKRSWSPEVTEQGWRFHMSNVNAAIGIAQFNRRESMWNARKAIASFYWDLLSGIEYAVPVLPRNDCFVPHIFPIHLNTIEYLEKIVERLNSERIEFGKHYYPCHFLEYYNRCERSDLSQTEALYRSCISLPIHPELSKTDLERIALALDLR